MFINGFHQRLNRLPSKSISVRIKKEEEVVWQLTKEFDNTTRVKISIQLKNIVDMLGEHAHKVMVKSEFKQKGSKRKFVLF